MGRRHDHDLRARVAQEAARIMIEQGVKDFRLAKQKAAERIGLGDARHLPANDEIEAAVREHQRLFGGERHAWQVHGLRQTAHQAMQLLDPFSPRLVGPVLSGSATEHSDIQLHLFADRPETVELFLHNKGFRFESAERRYRLHGQHYRQYPVYRLTVMDADVDAAVFGLTELRQAPLSPVDGQPMQRATVAEVAQLIKDHRPALEN